MKKIKLFVFVLLISYSSAYSQFNKGSVLLGADLSFSTQTSTNGSNENKSSGFYISPTVAVATRLNTFWGGSLSYSHSKNESVPNNEQTNNFYGASIFCRKYKQVLGKVYAFVQGGINGGVGKFENNSGPDFYSESDNFNLGLNIIPGISVNVTKKVYIEAGINNIASVNYSHSKTSSYNFGNTQKGKSSGFGFSSSVGSFTDNLYFGFRFIIPRG